MAPVAGSLVRACISLNIWRTFGEAAISELTRVAFDAVATTAGVLVDGGWLKELVLPPGRYEYRLVVDGQWTDDPSAKKFVPNPHGGRNGVIEVQKV